MNFGKFWKNFSLKTGAVKKSILMTISIFKSLSIQFTVEYGKDPITFLDIFIKSKTLDTCRCLPCSSSHPKPCKKNALFTLPRRICTIVENTEKEKRERSKNLKLKFSKFQFKKQLIECGI